MNLSDIAGLTPIPICEHLTELARACQPGSAITEIGVYRGRSLAHLAAGAADGVQVHGVDPWGLNDPEVYSHSRQKRLRFQNDKNRRLTIDNLRRVELGDKVQIHHMRSLDAAKQWRGPEISLLHIDGDHSQEAVYADIRAWLWHLRPGATVTFDDYTNRFLGVVRAVDQACSEGLLHPGYLFYDRLRVTVFRGAEAFSTETSEAA